MITPEKIVQAIRTLLRAAHPAHEDEPYTDKVPQDFKRPSLFIESMGGESAPITRATMANTEKYRVWCFSPIDDYGHSEASALRALQESVRAVFDKGCIRVEGRAPRVKMSLDPPQADYAIVNIAMEYTELRRTDPAELPQYDTMQDVKLILTDKE
ncbi:MAG TPA: hypothetical protein VN540_08525 [Clostridia bacterium]|nr:hypothetical protein [Clostridia bacterium]